MTSPHAIDREEVMAYLDGELEAPRAEAVRAHLAVCESCRALAADFSHTSTSLREWRVEAAPERLNRSVRDAAGRHARSGWSWWRLPGAGFARWLVPVATAAGIVLVAVLIGRGPRDAEILATTPAPAATARVDVMPIEPPTVLPQTATAEEPPRQQQMDVPSTPARSESVTGRARSDVSPAGPPVAASPPATAGAVALAPPPPVAAAPPPEPPARAVADRPVQAQAGAQFAAGGRGGGAAGRGFVARQLAETVVATPVVARSARLVLQAASLDEARSALEKAVASAGGRVSAMSVATRPDGQRSLDATIRVPVAELDATLAALRGVGRVIEESTASDDVAVPHGALTSELTAARGEQARLRDLLGRASAGDDVLVLEQALGRVGRDITRIEGDIRTLVDRSAFATIALRIDEGRF